MLGFWGLLFGVVFSGKGILSLCSIFLVGSAITKVGMAQKMAEGIAEKREGVRSVENVWGSALIAFICALGYGFTDSGDDFFSHRLCG